ncbi:MAG: rhodanese-like domain-containing protein, partial [SAR324 cluster bacterium]|nr:rhodanese-like domain-containing protein [SAR324 cluster bacterium]
VALLDGGWQAWSREERPTASTAPNHSQGVFTPRFRPELLADKRAVLAASGAPGSCVVNALSPDIHSGETLVHFGPKGTTGRKGHIAGSINLSALELVDSATNRFLEQDALAAKFAKQGILDKDRVITYCGAGIAAAGDAFGLALLGKDNVAVYDASLQEWAGDPGLPMEEGAG